MQRRIVFGRLSVPLTLLVCLLLPLLSLPTTAQAAITGRGGAGAPVQEEMPQLLLVTRRDPKAPPHDQATRVALQDAVIGLMRNTGHYQVTVYSPTQPLIAHALLIHSVSSLDLNEPLQPEGMRRLALALGIRTMLFLTPTFDKTGLKMEAQLHQNVAQDTWQIGITDEISTDFQYGKRRLNSKEVIALSVDALAARLSLPSHLAADLNLKEHPATVVPDKKSSGKGDSAHKDPAGRAEKTTPPLAPTDPDKTVPPPDPTEGSTLPTVPIVVKPDLSGTPRTKEPKRGVVKVDKPIKVDKPTRGVKRSGDIAAAFRNLPPSGATVQTDLQRPGIPAAQTVAHPNYETLSDHYHDNRDLANTITLLRYAVNERPRDITLRRKLIQAYQERKMPEAALAEITRALQIAPTEGSLYRAYGDTLMTKGDVPAAEKAFRDAVRLNADDIQARIALGDALMLDNQYADALDTYATAQKTDPRSPLPHRRLGRVLLLRASADPAQYAASLEEVNKARELTPKNDTLSYQEDYGTLMRIAEARLRELLEEISGNFIALNKGKQSGNDTLRALADIQTRTDTVNGYLDKLPYAVGQEATQVHYQQAAAFVLQSVTLFRTYLNKNDSNIKQQMQDASAEAYQELDTAHKRLADIRAALIPR